MNVDLIVSDLISGEQEKIDPAFQQLKRSLHIIHPNQLVNARERLTTYLSLEKITENSCNNEEVLSLIALAEEMISNELKNRS